MCFAGHPVLTGVLKNCQNVFQRYISGNIKATKMVLILLERARSSHFFVNTKQPQRDARLLKYM